MGIFDWVIELSALRPSIFVYSPISGFVFCIELCIFPDLVCLLIYVCGYRVCIHRIVGGRVIISMDCYTCYKSLLLYIPLLVVRDYSLCYSWFRVVVVYIIARSWITGHLSHAAQYWSCIYMRVWLGSWCGWNVSKDQWLKRVMTIDIYCVGERAMGIWCPWMWHVISTVESMDISYQNMYDCW